MKGAVTKQCDAATATAKCSEKAFFQKDTYFRYRRFSQSRSQDGVSRRHGFRRMIRSIRHTTRLLFRTDVMASHVRTHMIGSTAPTTVCTGIVH